MLVAGGAADGPDQVELVLRWLLSALLWPPGADSAAAGAARLAVSLGASSPSSPGRAQGERVGAGLGWPPADLTD